VIADTEGRRRRRGRRERGRTVRQQLIRRFISSSVVVVEGGWGPLILVASRTTRSSRRRRGRAREVIVLIPPLLSVELIPALWRATRGIVLGRTLALAIALAGGVQAEERRDEQGEGQQVRNEKSKRGRLGKRRRKGAGGCCRY